MKVTINSPCKGIYAYKVKPGTIVAVNGTYLMRIQAPRNEFPTKCIKYVNPLTGEEGLLARTKLVRPVDSHLIITDPAESDLC